MEREREIERVEERERRRKGEREGERGGEGERNRVQERERGRQRGERPFPTHVHYLLICVITKSILPHTRTLTPNLCNNKVYPSQHTYTTSKSVQQQSLSFPTHVHSLQICVTTKSVLPHTRTLPPNLCNNKVCPSPHTYTHSKSV